MINHVAAQATLKSYTNRQIERGLCMASKEVVEAIASDNKLKQGICYDASAHMMREFIRRFPNDDPKRVTGTC